MDAKEVYKVVHSSPEITTVGDYCGAVDSPAFQYSGKEDEFLSVKGPDGTTNQEQLERLYTTPKEVKDNQSKSGAEKLLKTGTTFFVPVQKINTAGLLAQGIEVVSNDDNTFKAKQLVDLEADTGYTKTYQTIRGKELEGNTTVSYPSVTVWLWCRSLSPTYDSSGKTVTEMEGEVFDITPFVSRVSTSVGRNGGNFQISLPPLTCELRSETDAQTGKVNNKWVIKKKDLTVYTRQGVGGTNLQYVQDSSMFEGVRVEGGKEYLKRNSFLFHTIVNSNDVVFIRFETLDMEASQRYSDQSEFYVSKENLAGRIYDMIGLVDVNPITIDSGTNDVTINISGRDLMKLFIEDGTYFYNLENITGQFRVAGESARENELMRRVVGDNSLYFLNLYQNTSIEHILQFIIQQLSSISVVPNSLLRSYGSRRNSKFTQLNQEQQNKKRGNEIESLKTQCKNSIRQYLFYQNNVDADSIYKKLHAFLNGIRKGKYRLTNTKKTIGWNPFVWVPSTGPKESLLKNEFPLFFYDFGLVTKTGIPGTNITGQDLEFNRSAPTQTELATLIDQVDNIIDLENTQPNQDDPRFDEQLAKGIWQIIKLVIDRDVTNRRLVDSSMSSANGSLLNFIHKACQEPFVEFFGDTYGDMYYLTVRKPPFDKKGIQTLLRGNVNTENGITKVKPAIIDIEPEDVIREELVFDDSEAYSWYNFRPQNVYAAGGNVLPAAYSPAIFFEEYAKIWGSRPLDVVHNYNPYYPVINDDGTTDVSRFEKQAVLDLKYLVESHAYLPFTRKGTLTLNGDRRIKRGNLIRYRITGEIFYVENVTQNFVVNDKTIDRTTVVTVSRGMVEQLIYGVDIDGVKNISYFNIINTEIEVDTKKYPPKKQTVTKKVLKLVDNPERVNQEAGTVSSNNITLPVLVDQEGQDKLALITNDTYRNRFRQLIAKWAEVGFTITILSTQTQGTGLSPHDNGKAIDVQLETIDFQILDSKASPQQWIRSGAVQIAKDLGFRWGGDFPNYIETIHFEIPTGDNAVVNSDGSLSPTQNYVETEIQVEEETPGYIGVDIEKALSNLKVNHDVFSFFLRREQFNFKEYVKTSTQVKEQG